MNLLIRRTVSRGFRPDPTAAPAPVVRPRPPANPLRDVLQSIESGDICSLMSLAILLLIIGHFALRFRPRWQPTVFRIGAFSFVALLALLTMRAGFRDVSLLVAGVIRSALCAAVIASVVAVVLPLVEFVVVDLLGWPGRCWKEWRFQRSLKILARRSEPLERWKLEHEERERQRLERLDADKKYEQQRRDNARFACQVLYDRYRSRIEARFSAEQLQRHFDRYLSDSVSADEFEKRIAQLKELIAELAESDGRNRPRFKSLIDLHEHYHQQQQAVLNSPYPEDVKQSLISDLAREEAKAIRESRQL